MSEDGDSGRASPNIDRFPSDEIILWQGSPQWQCLVNHVFQGAIVVQYFAVLIIWRSLVIMNDGGGWLDGISAATALVVLGFTVIGILALVSWAIARTATYTITDRRIAMTVGVALKKRINIPLSHVDTVSVKTYPGGLGAIRLQLKPGCVIPFLILWPHVSPWTVRQPQPMLRSIGNVKTVASVLATALATESAGATTQPVIAQAAAGRAAAPSERRAAGGCRTPAGPQLVPRVPMIAAAVVVALSLVVVGVGRFTGIGTTFATLGRPQAIVDLRFEPLGSDRIAILNARRTDVVAILEPGRDALIRGAKRGLDRARVLSGRASDAPYQLVRWESGGVTLSDIRADKHIRLNSAGPTTTGALAHLLRLGGASIGAAVAVRPTNGFGTPAADPDRSIERSTIASAARLSPL